MKLRGAAGAAMIIMYALLGWRLIVFLDLSVHVLRWPFGLNYAEGIIWQQALLMFTPEAYGRIDGFPTIVFHYTPLYHTLTRMMASLANNDMLLTGRAISIGSTLLTGGVVGLLVACAAPANLSRTSRFIAGTCGALLPLCFEPVTHWGHLMRIDMLAILLSFFGFWVGLKAFERPALIHVAALCFVAAVYTKQTSIAAPVALFGLMLWLKPRLARDGILTCLIMGGTILGVLSWATDGGFIRHVFLYNINRFNWSQLISIGFTTVILHGPLLGVAGIMYVRRMRGLLGLKAGRSVRTIADDPADRAWLGILFYFAAATLMLVTVAKSGADENYLIEWLFLVALLGGVALLDASWLVFGGGLVSFDALSVVGVPLVIAAQALLVQLPRDLRILQYDAKQLQEIEALSVRVHAVQKPVISDDMVMLLRNGKRVVWEPAIFAELACKGAWDEHPFVERIQRGEFAMFITVGLRGSSLFDSRYNTAVAEAIDEAYPVQENLAGYTLHLPGPAGIVAGAGDGTAKISTGLVR